MSSSRRGACRFRKAVGDAPVHVQGLQLQSVRGDRRTCSGRGDRRGRGKWSGKAAWKHPDLRGVMNAWLARINIWLLWIKQTIGAIVALTAATILRDLPSALNRCRDPGRALRSRISPTETLLTLIAICGTVSSTTAAPCPRDFRHQPELADRSHVGDGLDWTHDRIYVAPRCLYGIQFSCLLFRRFSRAARCAPETSR